MKIVKTHISGVVIIEPKIYKDERGYFTESFSERWFRNNVCDTRFVQDNESKSKYGVLRGLHFQRGEFAQAKLVRVIQGSVWDIAVDIRKDSPTFGQYVGIELSDRNFRQLFIPRGFAHGFSVLSKDAVFQYKCDNYYNRESEGAIAWNDPTLNIDWKLPPEDIVLSEKDKSNPYLTVKTDF